jgi:hypothetical protein
MRRLAALTGTLLLAALTWIAAPALSLGPWHPRARDFQMTVPSAASAVTARAGSRMVVTPVVRAPHRFDLLGVRWSGGGHVHVDLRVKRDGGRWSRWVEAPQADTGGASDRPLHGTDPVWAGGADSFQLRLSRRPRGLRVHFVNATGTATAADRAVNAVRRAVHTAVVAAFASTPARAQGERPAIVDRAGWGADQCPPRTTPSYGRVDLAFVHHTVSANEYSAADSPGIVLAICRYHRNSNGWNDIGYNLLVDKYGQVFEGRAGGVDQAVIGAQAQGYNSVSAGVANIGTHSDVPQNANAVNSLANLLAWKLSVHGAPVEGRVTVTSAGGSVNRYPSGRRVTFERISGHRDGDSTECPGSALYAQLPRLRELAAQRAPAFANLFSAPRLSIAGPTRVVEYPNLARFEGRLVQSGAAIAGAVIRLQALAAGGRKLALGTATTGTDGEWALSVRSSRNRSVRAVQVTSSGGRGAVSPTVALTIAPSLAARAASRRVVAGRGVLLSGTVAPRKTRVLVQVQRQLHGPFRSLRTLPARVNAGRFRLRVTLARPALYRLRVVFSGDRANRAARAPYVFVRAVRHRRDTGGFGR